MTDIEERAKMQSNADTKHFVLSIMTEDNASESTHNILTSSKNNEESKLEEMLSDIIILDKNDSSGFFGDLHSSKKEMNTLPKIMTDGLDSNVNIDKSTMIGKRLNILAEKMINADKPDSLKHSDNNLECSESLPRTQKTKGDINEVSEMICINNDSQQIISTEIEERNKKIYTKEASNISDPLNKTEEMICFNDTNFTISVTSTENVNTLQENIETELNSTLRNPILEVCNGTETHAQSTNNIHSSQSSSKNTEKFKYPVISSQTETFTSMGKDDVSVNLVVPSENVNSKDQTSEDKFKSDDHSTGNEKNGMDTNVTQPFQVHFDIMGKSFEKKGSLSTTDSNKGEKTSLSLVIIKEGKDNESQSIEYTCADINEPTIENPTCSHQSDILACSDIKYFSQPCFPTFQRNFKEEEESEVSSTQNSQEIMFDNEFDEDISFLIEFLATKNKSEERYNGGKENENSSYEEKQSISENNDEENSKSVQLYNKNATSDITFDKHIHTGKQHSRSPSEICKDITNSKEDFNQYLLGSQGIGIQETPQSPDPFEERVHGSNINTETPYDKDDSNLSTKESSQEIISDYEINTVGDLTGEIIDEQIITEKENKHSCNREEKLCTSTSTANECSKLIELYNKNSISDIKHNQNIHTEIQHTELLPETFKNTTNSNDDSHEILSGQQIAQIHQKLPESPVLFMRNIHEINDVAQENDRNNDKEGNYAHMLQHEIYNSHTGNTLPSKRTEGLIIDDVEYILHKNSNIEAIVDQHADSGKGFQETAQRDITKLSTEQIKDRNEPTGNLNLSGTSYEHNLQFSLSIPIQDLGNRCENKESNKENKNKNDAETEIAKAGKQNCNPVLQYTYDSSKKEKHMSTLGDVINNSDEKDYEIMKSNNGHIYESELELVHKPDMTGQNAMLLADVSGKAVCNNYDNTEGTDKEMEEETINGIEEYYVAEMQHALNKPNTQVITSKNLNIEAWRENNISAVNTDNRFEKYYGKDSKKYFNDKEAPDRLNILVFPGSDEINQFPSTEVTYKSCTMKKIFSPELNKECTETSDTDCISKTIPLQDSSINNNWELKNAAEERQQPSIVEALNSIDNDQLIHESISPNPANLQKENDKLLSTQENNYFHTVNKTNFTENTKLSSPRNDTTYNKQSKKIGNLNLFKSIASTNFQVREFDPALNEHAILTNSCDEDYSEMSRMSYPQDINCHKNHTLTYMQYEDKQFNEDKIKESVDELFGSDNSFETWSDLENVLQTNHTDTIVDNILDLEIETAIKKYETNDSDQARVDQTNPVQSTTVQTDITGEVNICKHSICNNKQCTCATHCKLPTKRSIEALCLETISTNKKAKFDLMRLNNNYEQYDSDFCMEQISEKEKQTIYFLEEEEEEREDSGKEETEEEDEESNGTVPYSANGNCFVISDQKVPDADVDNSWMRGDLNQNEMYTNDQLITGTSKNEHLFHWNSPGSCTYSSQGTNLPRKCPLRIGLSKKARPTSLHQSHFTC